MDTLQRLLDTSPHAVTYKVPTTTQDYLWKQNNCGDTPLHLALAQHSYASAKFLLEMAAPGSERMHLPNALGFTPLHAAVAGESSSAEPMIAMIHWLLRHTGFRSLAS